MREIKFRGKCINNGEYGYQKDGDWVYGLLDFEVVEIGGDYVDVYYINDWERGYTFEVDVNTIGQYTGLKDKKDTKIFEGDIVVPDWISPCGDADGLNYDKKGEIKYLCGGYYIVPQYEHKVLLSNFIKEDFIGYNTVGEIYEFKNNVALVEVIGNIYDNKELLEEV